MAVKKILFADDDQDFREFMCDALEEVSENIETEFDIVEAKDGAEAIRLFDEESFDLVVTDYKMPKASAVEVIRHIVNTNPVPIIVISGFKEAETVDFITEGAIIFVKKPFDLKRLQEAFKTALSITFSEEDLVNAKIAIERLEKILS